MAKKTLKIKAEVEQAALKAHTKAVKKIADMKEEYKKRVAAAKHDAKKTIAAAMGDAKHKIIKVQAKKTLLTKRGKAQVKKFVTTIKQKKANVKKALKDLKSTVEHASANIKGSATRVIHGIARATIKATSQAKSMVSKASAKVESRKKNLLEKAIQTMKRASKKAAHVEEQLAIIREHTISKTSIGVEDIKKSVAEAAELIKSQMSH